MGFKFIFTDRMHELVLSGGTPYERGVEVDPSISRRGVVSFQYNVNIMM